MSVESGESPLDLKAVLGVLESDISSEEEVLDAYDTLSKHTRKELSLFDRDFVEQGSRLIAVTKKHTSSLEKFNNLRDLAPKALSVLGFCLNNKEIVDFLPASEVSELLCILKKLISETKDKRTCQYAFWCLNIQEFAPDLVTAELPELLEAVNKAATHWWKMSAVVELEGMRAIERLVEQCPEDMRKSCGEWGPLFLRLLVSPSHQTHSQAYEKILEWSSMFSASKEFLRGGASVLKTFVAPALKTMFEKGLESFALKTCTLLLRIFRGEIHSNTALFNSLLTIQEMAFRFHSTLVRCQAFQSWGVLIDILAENGVLTKFKFVELVMRVFTTRNASTEEVAMEKLATWWHYVQRVGPAIWTYFDRILKPLLQFSLGNARLGTDLESISGRGHHNPFVSLAIQDLPGDSGAQPSIQTLRSPVSLPVFPKAREAGLEILIHILRDDCHSSSSFFEFNLEPLNTDNPIPLNVCITNARVLISAVCELTKSFASSRETQLVYIWEQMTALMQSAGTEKGKDDSSKAVTFFLNQFQTLMSSTELPSHFVLKLFRLICAMPADVLSAPCLMAGAVMKCHAHCLCERLLSSSAPTDCGHEESFITVFRTLVECGSKPHGNTLLFLEEVGKLLDSRASSLNGAEVLWRLWSVIVHRLQEHISVTNRVDQDDLWPNFGCMYTALLMPVTYMMGPRVPQTVHKTMMKTWTDLYFTFARLAPLVNSAEANLFVEELSEKMLNTLAADSYEKDLLTLEHMVEMCHAIVNSVDFSSLTTTNPFMRSINMVPSAKRRSAARALGNLHSFISLLAQLISSLMAEVQNIGETTTAVKQKESKSGGQVGSMCSSWIDVMSVVVTHVTVSSLVGPMIEKLVPPLASLYATVPKKMPAKVCPPTLLQKMDRLWQEVCSMLQNHFKGRYDSDLLLDMAPLLQAAFTHTRRSIKNSTVQFWNAAFGAGSAPLKYPVELQAVLSKMKERTLMSLPGWSSVDVAVIEETPVSQMSQMDSQAPEPVLPGMPSPKPVRGSFLNKDTSPKPNQFSPKRILSKSENKKLTSSARKRLPLDLMPEKDFVVITNTPKKRRVLTEHQKEVMREKRGRGLPAMYNNLENSMDLSLMSEFSSDTQQDSVLAPSPADSVITIYSSQSQDLLDPKHISIDQPSDAKASAPKVPSVRRSARRASSQVQKEGTGSEDCRHSQKTSSQEMENKSSLSASSSQDLTPKLGEQKKLINQPLPRPNVLDTDREKLIDSSQSASSLSSSEKETRTIPSSRRSCSLRSEHLTTSSQKDVHRSPRIALRKTRSQDVCSSDSFLTVTGASYFTSLKGRAKKSSGGKIQENGKEGDLADREIEENESSVKKKQAVKKSSPPESVILVEETCSPPSVVEKSSADLLIPESPCKISSMCSEETEKETNAADQNSFVHSVKLKQSFVQLEKLSEVNSMDETGKSDLSLVAAVEDPSVQPNKFSFEPPVVCDEVASQGFPVELPVTGSLEQATVEKSQVRPVPLSIESQEKLLEQHDLFGFRGLLQEADKSSDCGADSKAAYTEISESMGASAESAEAEPYNPFMMTTLTTSPPHHLSAAFSQTTSTCASDSEKPSFPEESNPSSQRTVLPESQDSFDPTKESTLGESTGHARNRKQKTPKKIADPMLLRHTRRKKLETVKSSRRTDLKSQQKGSPVISKGKRVGTECPKSAPDHSPVIKQTKVMGQNSVQTRYQMRGGQHTQKSKVPEKQGKDSHPVIFGPQEVTPENKTSSTPHRDSTTSKKKVAKALGMAFVQQSEAVGKQSTAKMALFNCKEQNRNTSHQEAGMSSKDGKITSGSQDKESITEALDSADILKTVEKETPTQIVNRSLYSPPKLRLRRKERKSCCQGQRMDQQLVLPVQSVDEQSTDVCSPGIKKKTTDPALTAKGPVTSDKQADKRTQNKILPSESSTQATACEPAMIQKQLTVQLLRLKKRKARQKMPSNIDRRRKSLRLQAAETRAQDKEDSQRAVAEPCDSHQPSADCGSLIHDAKEDEPQNSAELFVNAVNIENETDPQTKSSVHAETTKVSTECSETATECGLDTGSSDVAECDLDTGSSGIAECDLDIENSEVAECDLDIENSEVAECDLDTESSEVAAECDLNNKHRDGEFVQILSPASSTVSSAETGEKRNRSELEEPCEENTLKTVYMTSSPVKNPVAQSCDAVQTERCKDTRDKNVPDTSDVRFDCEHLPYACEVRDVAMDVNGSEDLFASGCGQEASQSVGLVQTKPVQKSHSVLESRTQENGSSEMSQLEVLTKSSVSTEIQREECTSSLSVQPESQATKYLHEDHVESSSIDQLTVGEVVAEDKTEHLLLDQIGSEAEQESVLADIDEDASEAKAQKAAVDNLSVLMTNASAEGSDGLAGEQLTKTSKVTKPQKKKVRSGIGISRRRKRPKISKRELFRMIDQSDATAEEIIEYVQSKTKFLKTNLVSCASNTGAEMVPENLDQLKELENNSSTAEDVSQIGYVSSQNSETASFIDEESSLLSTMETMPRVDKETTLKSTRTVSQVDKECSHSTPTNTGAQISEEILQKTEIVSQVDKENIHSTPKAGSKASEDNLQKTRQTVSCVDEESLQNAVTVNNVPQVGTNRLPNTFSATASQTSKESSQSPETAASSIDKVDASTSTAASPSSNSSTCAKAMVNATTSTSPSSCPDSLKTMVDATTSAPASPGGNPQDSSEASVPKCATPSILKKTSSVRSLETESPDRLSQKRRRVSFANPVISGESPAHEATLSKMYCRGSPRRPQIRIRNELGGATRPGHHRMIEIPSPKDSESQSQSQLSQSSYHSTQDSQPESTEPTFPDLADCTEPINIVLPHLTTSVWTRGLESVLRAQGVDTIGILASLPKSKVRKLPIVEPKVENLKKVLAQFHSKRNPDEAMLTVHGIPPSSFYKNSRGNHEERRKDRDQKGGGTLRKSGNHRTKPA